MAGCAALESLCRRYDLQLDLAVWCSDFDSADFHEHAVRVHKLCMCQFDCIHDNTTTHVKE